MKITTKRIIMSLVTLLALTLNLNSQELIINDVNKKDTNALIGVFDTVGLNNLRQCNLGNKNIEKFNTLVTKKSLVKMKISKLEYLYFGETIHSVGHIESKQRSKLIRKHKKLMDLITYQLNKNNKDKAKDVIGVFSHLNIMIEEEYSQYDKVAVVIASNLRDSIRSKSARDALKTIELNPKIRLYLLAGSGLSCLKDKVTSSQRLIAETSLKTYYKQRFPVDSNVVFKTIY